MVGDFAPIVKTYWNPITEQMRNYPSNVEVIDVVIMYFKKINKN